MDPLHSHPPRSWGLRVAFPTQSAHGYRRRTRSPTHHRVAFHGHASLSRIRRLFFFMCRTPLLSSQDAHYSSSILAHMTTNGLTQCLPVLSSRPEAAQTLTDTPTSTGGLGPPPRATVQNRPPYQIPRRHRTPFVYRRRDEGQFYQKMRSNAVA